MTLAIDTHALMEVVWVSLVLGLIVSVAFAAMLYGVVRSTDLRRDGNRIASLGFTGLALLGVAITALVVVYGFYIIIAK